MKFTSKRFKKPTLLSAAAYIFMLTLVAKGFFLFAIQHPSREELLSVQGIIRKVRLGGDGKSTSFLIESDKGTYRYSSYYGKVWPGMELINPARGAAFAGGGCRETVQIGKGRPGTGPHRAHLHEGVVPVCLDVVRRPELQGRCTRRQTVGPAQPLVGDIGQLAIDVVVSRVRFEGAARPDIAGG